MLALNAAVEAAWAGDAGRGFAVVAEEVRSLALRAAAAAQSTESLIERSVAATDRGVRFNDEVLGSLKQITSQIAQVAAVVEEIAAASAVQVDGVRAMTQSVAQVNEITQQVAASAEESASAAEELNAQAAALNDTVTTFTLEEAAVVVGRVSAARHVGHSAEFRRTGAGRAMSNGRKAVAR